MNEEKLSNRDQKLYEAFKQRTNETDEIIEEFEKLENSFEDYQDHVLIKIWVNRILWFVLGFIFGIGYLVII